MTSTVDPVFDRECYGLRALRRAALKGYFMTLLPDEAADVIAEVERLRAGGCARGQTTTQFCAEAERLRNELAARCGIGGAGAHTAGPTETFIPEAL